MLGQIWTCSFCNHSGNQWRNIFCDACGMPRALNVKPQSIEETTLETSSLGVNLDNILNISNGSDITSEPVKPKTTVPEAVPKSDTAPMFEFETTAIGVEKPAINNNNNENNNFVEDIIKKLNETKELVASTSEPKAEDSIPNPVAVPKSDTAPSFDLNSTINEVVKPALDNITDNIKDNITAKVEDLTPTPVATPKSDTAPSFDLNSTNIEVVKSTLDNNTAVEELFFNGNKKQTPINNPTNVNDNTGQIQLSEIEEPFNKNIALPKTNRKNVRPPVKQTTILYATIALTAICCILITFFTVNMFNNKNNIQIQAMINQNVQKVIESKLPIIGYEWSRSGNIGYYKITEQQGYSLPSDAELISSTEVVTQEKTLIRYDTRPVTKRTKIGTIKTYKGKKRLPNGQYQDIYETKPAYSTTTEYKKVPIYKTTPVRKTKYVYRIKEWVNVESFSISGQDKNSYWPTMDETYERSDVKEEYRILVRNSEGEIIKIPTTYELWQQYELGTKVSVQLTDTGWKIIE